MGPNQGTVAIDSGVEEVVWVEHEDSFDGLAEDWEELAARAVDPSPFDLHCWYRQTWDAFFRDLAELAICTVRRDDRLVGVLPLVKRGHRLESLATIHSCAFRPLAADGRAARALLRAAMGGSRLRLGGVPVEDGWPDLLAAAAARASRSVVIEPSYRSPYIDTTGDLEAWRKANKQRWQAPLEKKRRKMHRDHQADFAIVTAPVDLEYELTDGLLVEAGGWKGENGTAVLSRPDTARFYRGVARAFEARDELRLSRIALDGRTVAFDLALQHGNRLHSLKVGYDESFRSLAPALVMRLSMIERCFELDVRTHELLGDEAPWKAQFSSGTRDHIGFFAFGQGFAGRSLHAYRAGLRPTLRRTYRTFRPHGRKRRSPSR